MSMAKKMISRLSVLAVLIVFLAAGSKQTEYTNVIEITGQQSRNERQRK